MPLTCQSASSETTAVCDDAGRRDHRCVGVTQAEEGETGGGVLGGNPRPEGDLARAIVLMSQ